MVSPAQAMSFERRAALGLVPGCNYYTKFGRNSGVTTGASAAAPQAITDAGISFAGFPTTPGELVRITSSSAADTAGGTGAQAVRIWGVDNNGDPIDETVATAGLTPVTTTKVFYRVYRAIVTAAGSGGRNAGTLTIQQNTTTTNIFSVIQVGRGRASLAIFTVPSGYRGIVVRFDAEASVGGASAQEAEVALLTRDYGSGSWIANAPTVVPVNATTPEEPVGGYVVESRTDIQLAALSASAACTVVGRFDIYVVPNSAT